MSSRTSRSPGFPGVLVIGDIANIPDKHGKTHPQLGSVALQSGSSAAKTILADRAGKTAKPFSYLDKGTMAMIGRGAAVAQVKGVELHGKLAFAAWLGVHAALMTGGSNRVGAFKSWALDYFGKDRAPQALDRSGTPRMDVGRGRSGRAGGRDRLTGPSAKEGGTCPTTADSTSSSSAAAPVVARSPATWPRPGKRILILERGDWLPRELENWDSKEVFVENRYVPKETWYDSKDKPFQPGIHYAVGGATKLYGAALYRLRPEDFGELRHHDGISPAWPISYDDMEPYYTKAEHLYEVHGNHGEDATEGHASAQYPFPALTHEPRIQQLSDDLERAGYHPFHAPCGVRLLEDDRPNSRCIRCQTCDGFPCLVQAKSDAEMLGVRPALEHSNVSLRTRAMVTRLETERGRDRRRAGHRRARRRRGDLRRRHRGDLGRGGQLGQDPARIRQRPTSERPGQRLRAGRPQLHVPQQRGRPGDLQGTQPDDVPEDARA